jgi:nucleotide-binding universal stress UspA family protein
MATTSGSIVAGTDGSETAMVAVRAAAQIAKATGAPLRLVCAYDAVPGHGMAPEALAYYDPCEDAEGCLHAAAESVREDGLEVRTHAIKGGAASALLEVAEASKAALIVVGNRGMSGGRRHVLGSVPDAVSHRAPCNVMIVRTG